jgi:hypothetical protein
MMKSVETMCELCDGEVTWTLTLCQKIIISVLLVLLLLLLMDYYWICSCMMNKAVLVVVMRGRILKNCTMS